MRYLRYLLILSLFSFVFGFVRPSWAGCGPGALEDQKFFANDLRVLKERVSGYERHVRANEQLEAQRLAGVASQRQRRLQEEQRRSAGIKEFSVARAQTLKANRRIMMTAWREHDHFERERQAERKCAGEAFARERRRFEQAKREILRRTEERDLDIYAR